MEKIDIVTEVSLCQSNSLIFSFFFICVDSCKIHLLDMSDPNIIFTHIFIDTIVSDEICESTFELKKIKGQALSLFFVLLAGSRVSGTKRGAAARSDDAKLLAALNYLLLGRWLCLSHGNLTFECIDLTLRHILLLTYILLEDKQTRFTWS